MKKIYFFILLIIAQFIYCFIINVNKKISVKFDISIGDIKSNDEHYAFYFPLDAIMDRNGNIYILDSGNHCIKIFNEKGKYLKTIGQKGQGPLEFYWPRSMDIDEQDNLLVLDSFQRKVHVISPDREEDRIFTVASLVDDNIRKFQDGGWTVLGNYIQDLFIKKPLDRIKLLNIHSNNGKIIKSIVNCTNFGDFDSSSAGNRLKFDVSKEGSIYITFLFQNKIEKYDRTGKLIWSINRPLNYKAGLIERAKFDKATGEKMPPKFNQCSSGIAVDSTGKVWVLTLSRQLRKDEEIEIATIYAAGKVTMKVIKGNQFKLDTDAYKLEVFSPGGVLIESIPINHFATHLRIFGNNLLLIDQNKGMKVYKYTIIENY